MSGCDLSVLDYLRKAAIKLELTQDDDIYELEESEIALRINQHYKVNNASHFYKISWEFSTL